MTAVGLKTSAVSTKVGGVVPKNKARKFQDLQGCGQTNFGGTSEPSFLIAVGLQLAQIKRLSES